MILDKILAHKYRQVAEEKQLQPLRAVKEAATTCSRAVLDFPAALSRPGLQIIAEVKRASPSKGLIAEDFKPRQIAEEYAEAGAAAVSVLTERQFFMGDDAHLQSVRQGVDIPLLRKDFVIDAYQIYQARALGADAILLIVAALRDEQLRELLDVAQSLGMHCLVEVHSAEELQRALRLDVQLLGINNRDLRTFAVDLGQTARLRPLVPEGICVISESGIHSAQDMRYLENVGVDAVLVGETLMRAPSIKDTFAQLRGAGHDSC